MLGYACQEVSVGGCIANNLDALADIGWVLLLLQKVEIETPWKPKLTLLPSTAGPPTKGSVSCF